MVIRVFVSKVCGNKEIKRKQEFIISVLNARKVSFEEIDISDPINEEHKLFMREKGRAKEGQAAALPPQIFNSDEYCGDYESFHDAVEENTLFDLLRLTPGGGGGATSAVVGGGGEVKNGGGVVEPTSEGNGHQ